MPPWSRRLAGRRLRPQARTLRPRRATRRAMARHRWLDRTPRRTGPLSPSGLPAQPRSDRPDRAELPIKGIAHQSHGATKGLASVLVYLASNPRRAGTCIQVARKAAERQHRREPSAPAYTSRCDLRAMTREQGDPRRVAACLKVCEGLQNPATCPEISPFGPVYASCVLCHRKNCQPRS
jgi:hypothetical protein